jgi:phosphatidate cytidylyltransferase
VLAAVWFGPPWSDVLILVSACVLLWEWLRLVGASWERSTGTLIVAVLAGLTLAVFEHWEFGLVLFALGTAGATVRAQVPPQAASEAPSRGRSPSRTWGLGLWLGLGGLYIGLPGFALLWLRDRPDGLEVFIWLLLVVWSVDIFAYVAGRSIGGPKLWPAVSPKKTWAGLIGGVLAAALVGGALAFADEGRDPVALGVLAAILAVVAQAGDLLESAVKRRFGVKDASGIIPGHGGLLDRVDGLLAASLALAAALWLALV